MNHLNPSQTTPDRKDKKILPVVPLHEADLPSTKSATQETIDRLQYESRGYTLDINGNGEEIDENGVGLSKQDSNFKSELEFDGYDSILEDDNNAYSSIVGNKLSPTQELQFSGRSELDNGEESPVDHQENKSGDAI